MIKNIYIYILYDNCEDSLCIHSSFYGSLLIFRSARSDNLVEDGKSSTYTLFSEKIRYLSEIYNRVLVNALRWEGS